MNKRQTNTIFLAILTSLLLVSSFTLPGSADAKPAGSGTASGQSKEEVATIIYNTGKRLGANDKAILAAFETAVVESDLKNLSGGNSDSVGVFQMRPSMGWGSKKQLRSVSYSAKVFYKGNPASSNPKGAIYYSKDKGLSAGAVAQRVQLSAFPERYNSARKEAKRWINKVS